MNRIRHFFFLIRSTQTRTIPKSITVCEKHGCVRVCVLTTHFGMKTSLGRVMMFVPTNTTEKKEREKERKQKKKATRETVTTSTLQ